MILATMMLLFISSYKSTFVSLKVGEVSLIIGYIFLFTAELQVDVPRTGAL